MEKIRADPDSPPHLIARIDDPRHADLWRGQRIGASRLWFEDALCPQETTARALVNQVFRANARQILLCGDSRLALAVLLELAHRAWERRALAEAAASGRAAGQQAYPHDGPALAAAFRQPAERIVLLDRRAEDLRREYLATSPRSLRTALPAVETCSGAWRDQLLACLDIMTSADAAETAVLIADAPTEDGLHEAGRVARLHPRTPVFVLSSDGAGVTGAAFDRLHPFQRAFLVDGQAPEDTWTRIARHWHECYRLMHPAVPGGPKELTRRPWSDLPPFIREDNILQLRSVMAAVAARGRHWVPVAAVVPGSFVELSGHDLEEVARQEHSRWYERRWADGWRPAAPGQKDDDAARINSNVRPWSDLPAVTRQRIPLDVQSQLEQLEAVGFVPIVPDGGPGDSAEFRRVGEVLAERLMASQTWRRQSGDQLTGAAGDWSVVDDAGDERTIRDLEFRASHEQLSGNRWRRTGYVRAWRVSEAVALRTMEGRAVAQPGDWIVQGPRGERWPVSDEQFRRGYLPVGRT